MEVHLSEVEISKAAKTELKDAIAAWEAVKTKLEDAIAEREAAKAALEDAIAEREAAKAALEDFRARSFQHRTIATTVARLGG